MLPALTYLYIFSFLFLSLVDYQWIMKQLPCLAAVVAPGLVVAKVCCCLTKGFLYMSVLIQVHRGASSAIS
jgi:hypothetical protein